MKNDHKAQIVIACHTSVIMTQNEPLIDSQYYDMKTLEMQDDPMQIPIPEPAPKTEEPKKEPVKYYPWTTVKNTGSLGRDLLALGIYQWF